MRTILLIVVAVLVPPVWGWLMHRLMMRLWPERQPAAAEQSEARPPDPLSDGQV